MKRRPRRKSEPKKFLNFSRLQMYTDQESRAEERSVRQKYVERKQRRYEQKCRRREEE